MHDQIRMGRNEKEHSYSYKPLTDLFGVSRISNYSPNDEQFKKVMKLSTVLKVLPRPSADEVNKVASKEEELKKQMKEIESKDVSDGERMIIARTCSSLKTEVETLQTNIMLKKKAITYVKSVLETAKRASRYHKGKQDYINFASWQNVVIAAEGLLAFDSESESKEHNEGRLESVTNAYSESGMSDVTDNIANPRLIPNEVIDLTFAAGAANNNTRKRKATSPYLKRAPPKKCSVYVPQTVFVKSLRNGI